MNFASDLLVLRLTLAKTVSLILSKEYSDDKSLCALCVTFYFMSVNLYLVMSVRTLTVKKRVIMLWPSFVFILHVDGVYLITKRNLITECILVFFLC